MTVVPPELELELEPEPELELEEPAPELELELELECPPELELELECPPELELELEPDLVCACDAVSVDSGSPISVEQATEARARTVGTASRVRMWNMRGNLRKRGG